MNNNTEVGEQKQEVEESKAKPIQGGKAQRLHVVCAPGTPWAIRFIMDIMQGVRSMNRVTLFVMPEKYLMRPINSGFVQKLSACPVSEAIVFAHGPNGFRVLTKPEIRQYILTATSPSAGAKPLVTECEQVAVNEI